MLKNLKDKISSWIGWFHYHLFLKRGVERWKRIAKNNPESLYTIQPGYRMTYLSAQRRQRRLELEQEILEKNQ